jgi:phosphoglycolate phosphatase
VLEHSCHVAPMPSPRYDLAIFDFDGTLADSFPWYRSVLNQAAERYGFRQFSEDEIDAMRDMHARDIVAKLGVPAWKLPLITNYVRRLAAENAHRIKLYPGAAETLTALHASGMTIAIVSFNSEGAIRAVLGDQAGLISHYACGTPLWRKAVKFKTVLKAFKVSADRAISIGDEARDIDAARSAGICAGAVAFGYNSEAALRVQTPDLMFESFEQMTAELTGS